MKKKIVGMMPIKLNNERIPGKNLKQFYDGKPLISFVQETLLKAKALDAVYVYCSNEAVKEYIHSGVHFLKRPAFLDGNDKNCNDIIREFTKEIDADIYVVSHATAPFTRSESIDLCVEQVLSGQYDSAFLARRLQEFLWRDGKPLNFDPQHFPRTQDLTPIYSEAPGAYVFTKESFLKYDRRVGKKVYIHEISEIESRDIDYEENFEIANAIYKSIINNIPHHHPLQYTYTRLYRIVIYCLNQKGRAI
jgi:CMP-N-acetylneuraminic acid synthetase